MDLHDPDLVNRFYAGKSVRRIRPRDPLVEEYENRQLQTFLNANQEAGPGQNTRQVEGFSNLEEQPDRRDVKYAKDANRKLRLENRRSGARKISSHNAMAYGIYNRSSGSNWDDDETNSLMAPEGTVITDWEDFNQSDAAKGDAFGVGRRNQQAYLMPKAFQYDQKLPVVKYREAILRAVENNPIVIIRGSTGSGKSTQIPLFLMDSCHQAKRRFKCVVTQPRRIAATSICGFVNRQRKLEEGRLIGYHIGLDKKVTEGETQLTYMTTGVLLKRIVEAKSYDEFTHIILDEIHDRDQDTDFVMLLIKRFRQKCPHVKIILMSATCEASIFTNYFKISEGGMIQKPPVIDVEGKEYDVKVEFIESMATRFSEDISELKFEKDEPNIDPLQVKLAVKQIQFFDTLDQQWEKKGAVLVFLPGMSDIMDLNFHLETANNVGGFRWRIHVLHSELPFENQRKVFQAVNRDERKIILSTNIGESSITVEDVVYVIDFCLSKEMIFTRQSTFERLKVIWAAKSNCLQRTGRAGRVREGFCFRMIRKCDYEILEPYPVCELLRAPLERVVLNIKLLDPGSPESVLGLAIEPPDQRDINRAVMSLKELGALSTYKYNTAKTAVFSTPKDGEITFLGKVLAALPLDVKLSKLIVMGWVFGVLEETLIIAACLNDRGLFTSPPQKRLESFEKRLFYAQGTSSDLLALLHVYQSFEEEFENEDSAATSFQQKKWCEDRFVEFKKIKTIKTLKDKLQSILRQDELGIHAPTDFIEENKNHRSRLKFLRLAICGAFYPNYFITQPPNKENVLLDSHLWPPKNVVRFHNLPDGLQIEELACIRRQLHLIFQKCLQFCPKIELHVCNTRLYVVFEDPASDQTYVKDSISKAVILALAMRSRSFRKKVTLNFGNIDSGIINNLNDPSLYTPSADGVFRDMVVCQEELYDNPRSNSKGLILKGLEKPRNCMQIPLGDISFKCTPIWVHDPMTFCLQRSDPQSDGVLNRINGIIQKIVDNGDTFVNVPKRLIKKGTICLATYDELYYRCEILQDLGKEVQVLFVDYGNTRQVKKQDLVEILSDYEELMEVPFQSCYLKILQSQLPVISVADASENINHIWQQIEGLSEQNYIFEVIIFSVTDGSTVHGNLYAYPSSLEEKRQSRVFREDPKEFFNKYSKYGVLDFREHLLEMQILETCEETPFSLRNNAERLCFLRKRVRGLPEDFVQTSNIEIQSVRSKGEVELSGPFSALELSFKGLTKKFCGAFRGEKVHIPSDSLNCVAVSEADLSSFGPQLLVAGQIQSAETSGRTLLKSTTLMPKQPGFLEVACLMFSRVVEIRTDPNLEHHTGALCGMGMYRPDQNSSDVSVNPSSDMEITFDSVMQDDDYLNLNHIRLLMNWLMGPTDYSLRPNIAKQIGYIKEIRLLSKKLLKNNRAENMFGRGYPCWSPYTWNLSSSSNRYEPFETLPDGRQESYAFPFDNLSLAPFGLFRNIKSVAINQK